MVAQHPHAYKQDSICDQNDVHTTVEIDNKINYGYGTWEGKKIWAAKGFWGWVKWTHQFLLSFWDDMS